MKTIKILFILVLFSGLSLGQGRVKYNQQDLFLSGANLAWLSFSNDIGKGNTNLEEFGNILLQIHENGGNSLRWWLHTNGSASPEFDAEGIVISPGQFTISDLRSVLDLAWEREVGIKLCLWSFDMLRANLSTELKDRNLLMLTDTVYTNAYIENALIPMVDSLKGHPGIIAWEIFNEPEGMSDEFGWSEILHVPMSDIQRFINLTSAAIHKTDTSALVTSGCWSMQAMTDVPTVSLSKKTDEISYSEIEGIKDFLSNKYNFTLSTDQVLKHLNKISAAQNQNYYSDQALISAGGDSTGILDFYSVHYYDWAGTALSPFHNTSNIWQLDKPIVIGEFHMKNTLGIAKEDLYRTLYQTGYAGAMGWSWTDNAVTDPADMLEGMKYLWDNHRSDVDVLGIGGDWPQISILSPSDNSKFDDTSSVQFDIEAFDPDGDIISVQIFANDSLLLSELTDTPYTYIWNGILPGEYSIFALATDNDGHTRKSNIVRITYGEPPFKKYEAEAFAIPTGGINIINDASASGGNYVEFRTNTGSITWTINNYLGAGSYEIIFGFRLSFDSPKSQFINVNGERVTELKFEGDLSKWMEKSLMVDLVEGENTIQLELSWGWMDIDYLAVPRDVVTDVEVDNRIPVKFNLAQNYPNPFNPSTTIEYSIPILAEANFASATNVKLIVYDILGREVATIVNQEQKHGNYSVNFSGADLSSGIYFYSLETESFTQRKKMILLK